MKLFAIRHGEYVYPYDAQGRKLIHFPDSPLDQLGELQTRQLGEELKRSGVRLETLYTSPYPRARQTADILASDLGIHNVIYVDGLKDVFPNSAEGKPYELLEAIDGDIYANPIGGDPQESLDHLVDRVRSTIQSILTETAARNYVSIGFVSHGDTLSAIDWTLRHSVNPTSYAEMKNAFYLQKAEACKYTLDEQFQLEGEGEIITTESVRQSVESFRGSKREVEY